MDQRSYSTFKHVLNCHGHGNGVAFNIEFTAILAHQLYGRHCNGNAWAVCKYNESESLMHKFLWSLWPSQWWPETHLNSVFQSRFIYVRRHPPNPNYCTVTCDRWKQLDRSSLCAAMNELKPGSSNHGDSKVAIVSSLLAALGPLTFGFSLGYPSPTSAEIQETIPMTSTQLALFKVWFLQRHSNLR